MVKVKGEGVVKIHENRKPSAMQGFFAADGDPDNAPYRDRDLLC